MTQAFRWSVFLLCASVLSPMPGGAKSKERKAAKQSKSAAKAEAARAPGQIFLPVDAQSAGRWQVIKDDFSNLQVSAGNEGPAPKTKTLVLSYDLGQNGQWVQAFLEGPFDLSSAESLAFVYKGEGVRNSLEIKLETAAGETFGKLIEGATGAKKWTVAKVPLSEFEYWWGGTSKTLNARDIAKIYFAVSKKAEDAGKSGKILIADISRVPRRTAAN